MIMRFTTTQKLVILIAGILCFVLNISDSHAEEEDTAFTLTVTKETERGELPAREGKIEAYLALNGDPQYERKIIPPSGIFKPGATDTFEYVFNVPLAGINSILMRVEGDGEWMCSRITFQFFTKGGSSEPYTFDSYMWFAGAESNLEKLGAIGEKEFIFNPTLEEDVSSSQPIEASNP